MNDLAGGAALALAAVFAVAAIAKLRDLDATRSSFRGLGLPAPGPLALGVPAAEAAIAVALVVMPAIASWGAGVVLVAFTVVIVRSIAGGHPAPCACFGGSTARPVSGLEVARNLALLALVVVASGARRDALWPSLPAAVLVSVAVALGRVGLAVGELKQAGGHVFATPLPGEHRR